MVTALDSWHDIIRNGDTSALETLIADDAVFHSPVVHTPQVGKAIVVKYLTAAAMVLMNDSFHYVREMVQDHEALLEFQATIDDIVINGIDHIRWNDNNQIVEFKVWVRPLKAIQKLHQVMAKQLDS